jgi:trk system potassium uptake protein TrkH
MSQRRLTIAHSRIVAGFLLSAAPFAFLATIATHTGGVGDIALWRLICTAVSALALVLGSYMVAWKSPAAFAATLIGAGVGVAPLYDIFAHRPALSLALFMAVAYVFFITFPTKRKPTAKATTDPVQRKREFFQGSLMGYGLLWLILLIANWPFEQPWVAELFAAAVAIPFVSGIIWSVEVYRTREAFPWLGTLAIISIAAGTTLGMVVHTGVLEFVGILSAAFAFILTSPATEAERSNAWWRAVTGHPERLLVSTFLLLCVIGTVLLSLSESTRPELNINLIDAAFTAVSSVCVTGLIVLDTPHDFTFFGQFIILLLIQAGGLGIMTFSTAAIRLLGRKMSLRHEAAIARLLSEQDRGRVFDATRSIFIVTFVTELAGAAILFVAFLLDGDSVGMAAWRGIFTSISAFCNAGFALQSSSLVPYASNPLVLQTVATLIIVGGLSPVVVIALPRMVRRDRRVSTQTRLVVATTIVLLLAAFTMFLFTEWSGTLAGMSFGDKLNNAWFQSVTLRTAGFNSVDFSGLAPATYITALIMMFIGGSPGGTAGGIKTTTFTVIFLSVLETIRASDEVRVFRRSIAQETRNKATSITIITSALITGALFIALLTQPIDLRSITFEIVSAVSTVGLSTGATGELDSIGKIVVIGCMFLGRIGPLSLFLILNQQTTPPRISRPDVHVDVG